MSEGYQQIDMVARSNVNDPQQQQQQQQQQQLGGTPQVQIHDAAVRAGSFATARSTSPDDLVLSDDSVTRSPQQDAKPRPRQRSSSGARASSGGRKSPASRPMTMTRRTSSIGAKPGLPRMRSPSLGPPTVHRPLAVSPMANTPEARLTALEEQREGDHRVMNELVTAMNAARAVMEDLKTKANAHESELKDQVTMGLQLRRDVFAIRDGVTAGVNEAGQSAQAAVMTHMAATIEAKFAQLDRLTADLQKGLETLGLRGVQVEQVVQAQHDEQPKDKEIISGAFAQLDSKISHVAAMAKHFDGTHVQNMSAGAVVFTHAMKLDMEDIHRKINGIDTHIAAEVARGITPAYEQLAELSVRNLTVDESIAHLENALALQANNIMTIQATRCTTCGPTASTTNPWSHSPVAPGVQGQAGPSGDGDPLGVLRAVIGGNQACHCIHVRELQEKVQVLERAGDRPGRPADARGPDPLQHTGWQPQRPPAAAAPVAGDGQAALGRLPLPLDLRDPLGSVGHENRPVFDMKMTLQDDMKFNGVKDGVKWKSRVEGYFISCAPVLMNILSWAETMDNEVITVALFQQAVGVRLTHDQVLNVNAALWGFLRGVVSGTAETMFKRSERLNGIDAWRRLIRHIDHGREIRLNELRRNMKANQLKPLKSLQEIEHGVAEFENTIQEYVLAGGIEPSDKEMKDDMLNVLPEKIQSDLLWHSKDKDISFSEFRDLIVNVASRLMAIQRPSGPIHGVDEEATAKEEPQNEGTQMSLDSYGNVEDLVAAFERHKAGKGKKPYVPPRREAAARRDAPREQAQRRPRKCPNCGEEHEARVCPKPPVAIADRRCWTCNKPGHSSRDCKEKGSLKAIEDGAVSAVTVPSTLGAFFIVDEDGYRKVGPGGRPRKPVPIARTLANVVHKNAFDALKRSPAPATSRPSPPDEQPAQMRQVKTRFPKTAAQGQKTCNASPLGGQKTCNASPLGGQKTCNASSLGGQKTCNASPLGAPVPSVVGADPPVQPANCIKEAIREAEQLLGSVNCLELENQDGVIANTESSTRIRVAMDSAAVDNVIHPDELPGDMEYEPNTSGQHFRGANNAHIENFGSCRTRLTSARGDVGCDWRMADVSRPLHSVAKVTGPKGGPGKQDVLFDNDKCFVVAPGTVKKIMKSIQAVAEYEREGNLYVADMTLSGFGRQGAKE